MQDRAPVPRAERPPLPEFAPVPRRHRHDGWTPERQKAFVEALADTGCVSRAARMVNMAQANCYALRRAAGAEAFRRAWDAALDFGLRRLKDVAFERAIEGQLVPVFVAGKLMGFRRKKNDALLMFCLRHYGRDGEGRRTTVDYFSSRASAGSTADAGVGGSAGTVAAASTTTVRTVVTGKGGSSGREVDDDASANELDRFAGVTLDAEAEAAIASAINDCAARQRAAEAAMATGGHDAVDAVEDDPEESYVPLLGNASPWRGELEPPVEIHEFVPFVPGEPHWTLAGAEIPDLDFDPDGDGAAGPKAEPVNRRTSCSGTGGNPE